MRRLARVGDSPLPQADLAGNIAACQGMEKKEMIVHLKSYKGLLPEHVQCSIVGEDDCSEDGRR